MSPPPPAAPRDAGQMLQEYLAARDVPCPSCGYNLRDLTSDRCPECGDQLLLGVRMAEPKQAAPIAGLIGLSAGAGLNGLLLIYALVVVVFRERYGSFLGRFVCINTCGLLVTGAAIGIWLSRWRSIRSLGAMTRWTLVVLCWALSILDVVIFAALVR